MIKNKKNACILQKNSVIDITLFQRSSVVEQSAVNRSVVGSSPTAGAIKSPLDFFRGFILFHFFYAICYIIYFVVLIAVEAEIFNFSADLLYIFIHYAGYAKLYFLPNFGAPFFDACVHC